MNKLRICGDVHGKYEQYHNLIHNCEMSIQIGDMGFNYDFLVNNIDSSKHVFIPGNHDNYDIINNINHSLGDFGVNCIPVGNYDDDDDDDDDDKDVYYGWIRGAWSIDCLDRTPHIDWWEKEELTNNELKDAVDYICDCKPTLMLTHTCPESIKKLLLIKYPKIEEYWGPSRPSRTELALEELFNHYHPKLWIFGHFHKHFDKIINGTRFICIPELSYLDLDLTSVDFGIDKV